VGTYKYPAEFRADAVALARSSGRPVSRIAAELGVNHETLRQWIKAAEKAERPEAVAAHGRCLLDRHPYPMSAQLPFQRTVRRQAVVRHAALDELLRRDALLPGRRHQRGVELLAQSPVPDAGLQPPQGLQRGRIAGLGQRVDRRTQQA
jgi:transposase-like protein